MDAAQELLPCVDVRLWLECDSELFPPRVDEVDVYAVPPRVDVAVSIGCRVEGPSAVVAVSKTTELGEPDGKKKYGITSTVHDAKAKADPS